MASIDYSLDPDRQEITVVLVNEREEVSQATFSWTMWRNVCQRSMHEILTKLYYKHGGK